MADIATPENMAAKKTVFIANVAESVDETALHETFSTFGDVVDVQLPLAAANPNHTQGTCNTTPRILLSRLY